MNNRFAEHLTPDNAMFASIDHQTWLLIGVRDLEPTGLRNRIQAPYRTARILELPAVSTPRRCSAASVCRTLA